MAALVLALGIGANNAVFTLVNAVCSAACRFLSPSRSCSWARAMRRPETSAFPCATSKTGRRRPRTFSAMSFVFAGSFNVGDEGRVPEQFPGAYVSGNFFRMLGVSPALGRDFAPEEDKAGGPPVVLIGSNVWKQRYGSDPSVLGRTIRLNTLSATIIGVMPEGMQFPFDMELWMPAGSLPPAITQQPRQARGYLAIGRLADGVTVEQARAELKGIGAKLAQAYPATNKDL